MGNWDADEARSYHERTKHSFEGVRASAYYLDWDNRPKPFKEYEGIEPLALPDLARPRGGGAGHHGFFDAGVEIGLAST